MSGIVNNKTGNPLKHYREAFEACEPQAIAVRCNAAYCDNRFALTLLQNPVEVIYPHGTAVWAGTTEQLDDVSTILLLRYLTEGTWAQSTGKFLAYAEVPWGETYLEQFTGRCIKRLAFSYGNKLEDFSRACETLGGTEITGADCAYEVPFMQDLRVQLLVWQGDDEFPPSAQILFSDNFLVAFTAEDLAYVGDMIIGALKQF